jgi:hypothetical protein
MEDLLRSNKLLLGRGRGDGGDGFAKGPADFCQVSVLERAFSFFFFQVLRKKATGFMISGVHNK